MCSSFLVVELRYGIVKSLLFAPFSTHLLTVSILPPLVVAVVLIALLRNSVR